ncbi:MAG: hypothetical protein ACK4HQ_08060 [Brevinematales bacterium]
MKESLLREGKNYHVFLQEEGIRYHVVLSDEGKLIVATPSGNSGVLVVFAPLEGNWRGEYVGKSEMYQPFSGGHGVAFPLKIAHSEVKVVSVWMESIRWIRDMESENKQGLSYRQKVAEEFCQHFPCDSDCLFPYREVVRRGKEIVVRYQRTSFGKKYRYVVELEMEGVEVCEEGESFLLKSGGASFEVRVKVGFGFSPEQGKNSPFEDERWLSYDVSCWYMPAIEKAKEALRFLSLEKKLLAGSFRFLTYFGRDTLFTAMLLQPIVSVSWYMTALQSVLERLSCQGEVAHEEDIGDQAVFRRMEVIVRLVEMYDKKEFNHLMKNMYRPVYDYKMIDDDFLLSIAVNCFLKEKRWDGKVKKDFLESKVENIFFSRTSEALVQNFEWCVKLATPFGKNPCYNNLIRIKDFFVGDWRDSSQGLGFGVYPFSVNAVLVPAALKAIREIWKSEYSIVFQKVIKRYPGRYPFLTSFLQEGDYIEKNWASVKNMFLAKLSPGELFERIEKYRVFVEGKVDRYQAFLHLVRTNVRYQKWLMTEKVVVPEMLERRFSDQMDLFTYPQNKEEFIFWYRNVQKRNDFPLYALSLDENGRRVEVLHSDIGMLFLLADLSVEEIDDMLIGLQMSYPLGLDTPAGILVANPALSDDPLLYYALARRAYHGTVVWGWQQVMIQMGLLRQYNFLKTKGYEEKAKNIYQCLQKIWDRQRTAKDFLTSELWSWKVEKGSIIPAAYGVEAESATESNPYQLWSTTFLAAVYLYQYYNLVEKEEV